MWQPRVRVSGWRAPVRTSLRSPSPHLVSAMRSTPMAELDATAHGSRKVAEVAAPPSPEKLPRPVPAKRDRDPLEPSSTHTMFASVSAAYRPPELLTATARGRTSCRTVMMRPTKGDAVGVKVAVLDAVGVNVGVMERVEVREAVRLKVGVLVIEADAVAEAELLLVELEEGVPVRDEVAVAEEEGVIVGDALKVDVGEAVRVDDAVPL